MKNNLLDIHIPQDTTLINQSSKELFKFAEIIQCILNRRKTSRNNISFSESLAFRLLASIDWSETDLNEFKKNFTPLLTLKHLDLESQLIKSHSSHLKFKENEVKDALYLWSNWRRNFMNNSESTNEDQNTLVKKDDDLMTLYALSRWSENDSSMKFGTFLHYGIPRARLLPSQEIHDEEIPELLNTTYTVSYNTGDQSITPSSPTGTIPFENRFNQFSEKSGINSSIQSWKTNTSPSDDQSIYTSSTVSSRSDQATRINDSGISIGSMSPGTPFNTEPKTYYYRRKYADSIDDCNSSPKIRFSLKSKLKLNKKPNKSDLYIHEHANNKNNDFSLYNDSLKTDHKNVTYMNNNNSSHEHYLRNSNDQSKSKSSTKVKSVKGGLVESMGNVYFPSK